MLIPKVTELLRELEIFGNEMFVKTQVNCEKGAL
jgi:hypothetical protein